MDNFRNRVFWKACDKAKIRRRCVHDTRHTFASLLLSNGESLKYVSAQFGHASIRMTADVYGQLEIGSNRAAMDLAQYPDPNQSICGALDAVKCSVDG